MTAAKIPSLTALADRTDRLVSLPAVAMEVLRLTELPSIDAQKLCECLESDPALAAKLLRVVNSSLYSLPRQIASLREAIAIIGVQPLKMLVLGFALPDELLRSVSGEGLRRYWTEALTTATAARMIAEAGWGRLGDEAFAAGLMQGVGQLVLLKHLGSNYADLLAATANPSPMQPRLSPLPLESESLGFNHRELSAELIGRWRLPQRLVDAIDRQHPDFDLSDLEGDAACLAQALSMANQLTRLVVSRDLQVLSELLDDGQRYCGLSKPTVNEIVEAIQDRVENLAQAMSIELAAERNYSDTLIEAHSRLAVLAEQQAMRAMGGTRSHDEIEEDDRFARELLTETNKLTSSLRVFLAGGTGPRTDKGPEQKAPDLGAEPPRPKAPHAREAETTRAARLAAIDQQITRCRSARLPLSLVVLEVSPESTVADADVMALRGWLTRSGWSTDLVDAIWSPVARDRSVVMLPGVERQDANRLWSEIAEGLSADLPLRLNAGVAGVAQLSRGFEPRQLLDSAERCLEAARGIAGSAIKSIEVF